MAHEITERADGTAEMAFTGPRSAIWHGLGNQMEEGKSIEEWQKAAGMEWNVERAALKYDIPGTKKGAVKTLTYPDREALFRSDTGAALGCVSPKFHVVQPKEVLEFFRDLVEFNGMKLSTAGTLFGGKRFWALAEVGASGEVVKGDQITGNLLLTTAVDGTMATSAKFVSTRVVCNNTLTVAMNEHGKKMVRVTHKTQFDPNKVKIDLGILHESFDAFINKMKHLASVELSEKKIQNFLEKRYFADGVLAGEQPSAIIAKVAAIKAMAMGGSGAEYHSGTAWGLLCGATEYFTHGTERRNANHKFWDSYIGRYEKEKREFAEAVEAAF